MEKLNSCKKERKRENEEAPWAMIWNNHQETLLTTENKLKTLK